MYEKCIIPNVIMETELNPVYDNMTQVEDYILNFLDKGKLNSLNECERTELYKMCLFCSKVQILI